MYCWNQTKIALFYKYYKYLYISNNIFKQDIYKNESQIAKMFDYG